MSSSLGPRLERPPFLCFRAVIAREERSLLYAATGCSVNKGKGKSIVPFFKAAAKEAKPSTVANPIYGNT